MTIFSDVYNKTIDDQYLQAIEEDHINVGKYVIEKAKQGDSEAIHTIGCAYASAKDKDKATKLLGTSDIQDKAIKWLGTASAMGHKDSPLALGLLYKSLAEDCVWNFGDGDRYFSTAKEWLETAGEKGEKIAFAYLGDIYQEERSYYQARDFYRKSADLGDPYGQIQLGKHCSNSHYPTTGLYLEANYELAMEMFRKAADQKFYEAHYQIGLLYQNGYGVKKDYYQAIKWFHKSYEGGYNDANDKICKLNEKGYFFFPTEEEIKEKKDQKNTNTSIGEDLPHILNR